MLEQLTNNFNTGAFMPHGYCFLWAPSLLWTDVVSDLTTAISYLSIPFALWYFAQKRPDLPFRWVFVMFGVFVLACGSTHLFAVWNIWHADYWPEAAAKAVTASASISTAILLWLLMPKALAIPSSLQLESANQALQKEVIRRERAETELLAANEDLERRVAARTAELESASNSLRESEGRYRALADLSSDWYWEQDENLRFTRMSKPDTGQSEIDLNTFLGHTRSEAPGIVWDQAELEELEAITAARQPFRDFEIGRSYRDGPKHFVRMSGEPMFDASGAFEGYRGVGADITERKRSDNALQESEQELRAIFDGVLDGILVADVGTRRFVAANVAICGMLGYTHEEMIDIGISDIHPKQDLPQVAEQFERQLRGEIYMGANTPMIRKDGSVFYADIKAAPIHLGGKDVMLGIFRDVTERIRSEKQLAEGETQFRSLVEQSIAGTYIVQDGKFTYINPRYAEIFGYASADELIGRDVLTIVAEKDRSTMAENIRRRIDGEIATINYEFSGRRKDGSTIVIGVHGARAAYRGRPAVIGMIQDISEKKRNEDEIKRYIAQLETAFMSTVEVATTLGEMRDPYTAGHQRRVAEIAVAIGAELGFDARRQEGLRVAGYLHDIGKITVPAEILSKPGKLGPIELTLIQGHAQSSYEVLKNVQFPWPVAEIALQHHERMDGSGYPQGLKGEAILLEARIMAVADVVEAMSSHRPYRPGLGIDKTLAEIERGRGSVYDPDVADACLKLFREKNYALPA